MLVGTWAAAVWAIRFYERHGFALVPDGLIAPLLRRYWDIPGRQVQTSVVLADPPIMAAGPLTQAGPDGSQAPGRGPTGTRTSVPVPVVHGAHRTAPRIAQGDERPRRRSEGAIGRPMP